MRWSQKTFVAVPEEVKDFFRVLAAKGALVVVSKTHFC